MQTLVNLYTNNSVLIRVESAVKGKEAIQEWIALQLQQYQSGKFNLIDHSQNGSVYSFRWDGCKTDGNRIEGRDTLGVKDDKVLYHYAFTKEQDPA